MAEQPNILFICTDQQSAGVLSAAGHENVETPAFDELAERGIRFEEAYCTEPVCTPSRASMLTGRMPHETGVVDNGQSISKTHREESLGKLVQDAGYKTAYGGKWHLPSYNRISEEEAVSHGFDEVLSDCNDQSLTNSCVEFLKRSHDEPFFLTAMFDNPHNICEWPWGSQQPLPCGNIEQISLDDCPMLPKNFSPPPFEPKTVKQWRDNRPMTDRPDEEWRHYLHAYFRMVEMVDRQIGRILETLDDVGLTNETIIVFTSDHGDMQGAHQLEQKWVLYEESVHVPFIAAGPGIREKAVDKKHLISTGLDLVPTLVDYAGVDPPTNLRGRSLRPIFESGEPDNWRDYLVSQSHELGARMVRTGEYKYITYDRGPYMEQLFDMSGDRDELINLATSSNYSDILDRHRKLLLEWCAETDDLYNEFYTRSGIPTIPGWTFDDIEKEFEESRENP